MICSEAGGGRRACLSLVSLEFSIGWSHLCVHLQILFPARWNLEARMNRESVESWSFLALISELISNSDGWWIHHQE